MENEFKLFHNLQHHSEREYHGAVFTPPRDDFGMAGKPPVANLSETEMAGDTSHPTKQAICIILRVICCFAVAMAIMLSFYKILSSLVQEPIVYNCNAQRIQHGQFMPGMEGDLPFVKCDKHYMTGAPVALKCAMTFEHCVVTKKATVVKAAVKKCTKRYAYAPAKMAEQAMMNTSITMKEIDKMAAKLVPHACLFDPSQIETHTSDSKSDSKGSSKLYKERKTLPLRGTSGPLALSATSISCAALLALIPVAALMVAGIMQRRRDYEFRLVEDSCPCSAAEEALE